MHTLELFAVHLCFLIPLFRVNFLIIWRLIFSCLIVDKLVFIAVYLLDLMCLIVSTGSHLCLCSWLMLLVSGIFVVSFFCDWAKNNEALDKQERMDLYYKQCWSDSMVVLTDITKSYLGGNLCSVLLWGNQK